MKILHLISSARGAASFSLQLGNAIVERLVAAHPDSSVTTHDLANPAFPHLDPLALAGYYTPGEHRTPEMIESLKRSDESIAELLDADTLVIGVPMENLTIPSTLKAWIDHVARVGVTFRFTESGAVGLVTGKKVYLAIASGGMYREEPLKSYDFTEIYMRKLLGFLGMTDVSVFRVDGVAIPGMKESALQAAIGQIELN